MGELEEVLETALGTGVTTGIDGTTVEVTLPDDDQLKIELNLRRDYQDQLPLKLDLSSLNLSDVSNLVDVKGSAEFDVRASGVLAIDFGLDLQNPHNPRAFLYDTTQARFEAKVDANDLDFLASMGPLGVYVVGGNVVLDADGASTDPAFLAVALTNGRHYFGESFTFAPPQVSDQLQATLPINYPTETESLDQGHPNLVIYADLSDGTTNIDPPNFLAKFGSIDLSTDISAMVDGWSTLFDLLEQAVDSQVLSANILLIGDQLQEAARFVTDLRRRVGDNLELAGNGTFGFMQQRLFEALGPGGLDWLQNADANPELTKDDVVVTPTDPTFATEEITFDVQLSQGWEPIVVPVEVDLALPGLGIEIVGNVQLKAKFDFGFGVSKTHGVFLDTGRLNELTFQIDATIPGLTATGSLGFLQLDVTLLDLAAVFGNSDIQKAVDFIEVVATISDLADAPDLGGTVEIPMGSLTLDGADLRSNSLSQIQLPGDGTPLMVGEALSDSITSGFTFAPSSEAERDAKTPGSARDYLNHARGLQSDDGEGFAFPLLDDPLRAFKLLLNQDVELFTYDMPALEASFDYTQMFPIWPPFVIGYIDGRLGAMADFSFGFDTSGIRKYVRSGDAEDVFTGFYVSDTDHADGSGSDVPEMTLLGSITATAEPPRTPDLGLGPASLSASAGVGGGLFAFIEIEAKLKVLGKTERWTVVDEHHDIADVKLLDFNYDRPETPSHDVDPLQLLGPPPLAAYAGGVLTLDTSNDHDYLRILAGAAPLEVIVRRYDQGNHETGELSGSFTEQTFAGVQLITAGGGAGDDRLYGGAGENVLIGGNGTDWLYGGEQRDRIEGAAARTLSMETTVLISSMVALRKTRSSPWTATTSLMPAMAMTSSMRTTATISWTLAPVPTQSSAVGARISSMPARPRVVAARPPM